MNLVDHDRRIEAIEQSLRKPLRRSRPFWLSGLLYFTQFGCAAVMLGIGLDGLGPQRWSRPVNGTPEWSVVIANGFFVALGLIAVLRTWKQEDKNDF